MADRRFKVKKGLIITGDTLNDTVLDIQGSQGQLFSITDSLTGELFSVNDISGISLLSINSDGTSVFDSTVTINDDLTVTGNVTANSFIKQGGTSSQFLKADGSVDSNTYLTTETDSQTLSWNSSTGELTISNGNTIDIDGRYLELSGGTLTGALNGTDFTASGFVKWSSNSRNNGSPRSLNIGYTSSGYGTIGYGLEYTATNDLYDGGDIPTKMTFYDGIILYSAPSGTDNTAISWTEVFRARRTDTAPTFKGDTIYHAGNFISGTDYQSPLGASTSYVRGSNFVNSSGFWWNGTYLQFAGDGASNNDYISYNDTSNEFCFNADSAYSNTTGNADLRAGGFIVQGGTSSQFLKADGSLDSSVYLTSYTETDTLDSVADRGATTDQSLTIGSQLTLTRSGGIATLNTTLGAGNDPQFIRFDESTSNSGFVWIAVSDDMDIASANDIFYIGDSNLTDWRFKVDGAGQVYTSTGSDAGANFVAQRIYADNYHPNADTWTTGRTFTVTLTGDITGTANASVDGSENETWSLATSLATNSVTANEIASNAVNADELNVTGNGTTSQYLRSDGDGTFTWATPPNTVPNNATITLDAGVGLTGGGDFTTDQSGNETITFTVDLSELTDMTDTMVGTDEFIVLDAGADRRKAASEIGLSIFNNDSGFITSYTETDTFQNVLSRGADFTTTMNYTPDTGTIISVDGQAILQRMTANGALTFGHDDAVIIAAGDTSSVMNTNINNAAETVYLSAEGGFTAYAFPGNDTTWTNRKEMTWDGTNLTLLGNNVWHAGNDGSGSGLDADLLDGLEGTHYLDYNNFTNTPTIGNGTLTVEGTGALGGSGTFTANQTGNTTISITHDDTSTQASLTALTGANVVSDIDLDTYGHVTNLATRTMTLADLGYTGATDANNYVLPEATDTVRGGIELFSNTDQSVAANAVSAIAGRTYGIQLNSSGQAVVNVPWTDNNTTYSAGSLLDLSGTTFNVDLSELTDMTATMVGTDEFVVLDASVQRRKAANEIGLSIFNNDSGFTTNTGTVTSVAIASGNSGISVSGGPITSSGTLTVSHADTSSQTSVNNSGRTYIQDITLDDYGHITAITSATETVTNTNQLTTFQVEDGDGTEVTISHAKEWKFVEGSGTGATIDINWTDTDNGTDADPYDLTFTVTNTDRGSSQNIFKNVAVSGQSNIVADSNNDTLTLAAGSNITITTNATTDTVTITNGITNNNQLTNGAGYITGTNVAYTNVDNNFSTSQTISGNGVFDGTNTVTIKPDFSGSTSQLLVTGGLEISTGVSGNISLTAGGASPVEINVSGNTTIPTLTVTNDATANSFIKSGGTSSQFLKADGSVDSTTYTSNSGTVTSVGVSAGTGLSGGGTVTTSGTITLNVDLSELTDMTAAMVGTDEFIVLDAGADRRKAANEIPLSIFNNDLTGYVTIGGTQTITGTKTFSADTVFSGGITTPTINNATGVELQYNGAGRIATKSTGVEIGTKASIVSIGANPAVLYLESAGNTSTEDPYIQFSRWFGGAKINTDGYITYEASDTRFRFNEEIILGGEGTTVLIGTDGTIDADSSITANSFIKSGGTSSQFLKADGSVDSNTYATTGSLSSYVTIGGTQTITGTKTFSADTVFSGGISIPDSVEGSPRVSIGDSDDLQLYHDSLDSYITNQSTGDLEIINYALSGLVTISTDDSGGVLHTGIVVGGATPKVELYYDNSKKLETTSAGIDITGDLTFKDGTQRYIYGPLNENLNVVTKPNSGTEGFRVSIDNGSTYDYEFLRDNAYIKIPLEVNSLSYTEPVSNGGNGEIVYFGTGTGFTQYDVYTLNSSGAWVAADADVESTSYGLMAIALGSTPSAGMLVHGYVYNTGYSLTTGSPIFLSQTAGQMTNTSPTATNTFVRVLGYQIATDTVFFKPDNTWIKNL